MELTTGVPHVLLYRRSGFCEVVLRLKEDGTVENPPGHAEVFWEVREDKSLAFKDAAGAETAVLRLEGDRFRGKLLDQYYAELLAPPSRGPRRAGPMRYFLFIPHVNRYDLLTKALASVRTAFAGHIVVVDNSTDGDLRTAPLPDCELLTPPVPLTFTQTQNWMQKRAKERECDLLFLMHSDGEAAPGAAADFLRRAEIEWSTNTRLGAVFTNYDVLCAFTITAIETVGPWDTVFTQYFADNDYYGRLERAGFEIVTMRDITVHHVCSATLHSDPHRQFVNGIFFPTFGHYLEQKNRT